ncbi:NAD-P-binding protein [Cubamyces sp. BRFM 1775]|nr:NAD-P-binding protein [Cubamyces sp. BRFM 1775]
MTATRPTSWLVTGASRGLGLEFVRQIVASPDNVVVATCRNPEKATELHDLKANSKGKLHIFKLDVDDFDGVRAAAQDLSAILGDTGLDYLISNAGIALAVDGAFTVKPEDILRHVHTNAAAPALVSQICLPHLEKGVKKTIVHVSSTGGSLGSIERVGARLASYGMSKTALNMLARKQQAERPDFTVLTVCPGWVKTGLGGDAAPLEPSESVAGLMKIITESDKGKYVRYNGETIPW